MSFNITYELFRGEVLSVVGGKASEPAVLIKCSNTFERLKDGSLFDQNMTFKIPCPDDLTASKVAFCIKNCFASDKSVSFSGSFPVNNFVVVSDSFDTFLSGVV